MADPLSQCAKYKILQTECILVHEMREKCFPNVSRGAIKSQMRRMNMLTILAPGELGTKLKQKYGKKQGGYYLTPVEEAHRLLATRATLTSQNDIPHTASHSDPFVPVISHSVTHGTPMQIPIDKPAESNPHYDSLNLDDSLSNLPDQETLIQPSGSKDIPALLPPLPSSPKSSPRTNKTIHESDSSESSIQASQPCLPSLPTQAGDQELSSDSSSPLKQPCHYDIGPNPRKRKHGSKRSMTVPITITFPPEIEDEIDNMLTFFSTPLNPQRSSAALSDASTKKLRQQILLFLQYLVTEKNQPSPGLLSCFKIKLVKSFADYLLTVIGMGHSSVKNYLAAMKNAITFQAAKSKKCAKKVQDSGILRRISNLSNQLEGRYKVQRRVFSDETSKFEWQDVLEVLRRMKVELQTFEGSKMERARMLHNYTILLMYATVAPVRNLEYMCLRLVHGEAPQEFGNYIEYHDDGNIIIRFRGYKTAKTHGELKLGLSCFPELTHTIEQYMKVRDRLLCGHRHNFFFMRRSGEPFQNSSQFSHYLQHSYKSFADGAEFTTTSLRKALTNYSFASNKPPEVLQGISRLMTHSDGTHKRYYHTKRSEHLAQIGAAALSEDTSRNLGFKSRSMTGDDDIPCVDQTVALVSGASTANKPEIWLAKVMQVDLETKRAVLAELVEEEANCYKFKIGSKYTEPFSSLIYPVDVCYDESHNSYYLRSSKLDIHNFVEEQHHDSSGSSDNYV